MHIRFVSNTALTLLLSSLAAQAGAELLLKDGQVLVGRSVERKETLYLLTLESDDLLPIPIELVSGMRLTGDDDPAPTGLEKAEPKTLVGPPEAAELPTRGDQMAVFGEAARFSRGVVDFRWRPKSGWNSDPRGNDFNPARWYTAPIDPVWKPRSAYRQSQDVTQFNPARWYTAPIDSRWRPRDGFGETRWFEPIVRSSR